MAHSCREPTQPNVRSWRKLTYRQRGIQVLTHFPEISISPGFLRWLEMRTNWRGDQPSLDGPCTGCTLPGRLATAMCTSSFLLSASAHSALWPHHSSKHLERYRSRPLSARNGPRSQHSGSRKTSVPWHRRVMPCWSRSPDHPNPRSAQEAAWVLDHIGSEERPIQSASSNAAEQQNASPRHSSRVVCMIHEPTANYRWGRSPPGINYTARGQSVLSEPM